MMRKLAAFVMMGRWQAAGAVVGFALLGLMVPPLTLPSGAALGLVTLRLGAASGLSVLGLAVLALTVLSGILAERAWIGAVYGFVQWTPLVILALVLRHTVSLASTLKVAAAVGLAVVLATKYLASDVTALWKAVLDDVARPVLMRAEVPTATIDTLLQQAAEVMTGSFVAAMLLSWLLALLLARWWQALLYNPGGFREEFTGLQLGHSTAGLALSLTAAMLLLKTPLMIELSMVTSVIFFLQGMAVAHAIIAKSGHSMVWLVGVYGSLLLALPQMIAGFAAMGAIDAFVDFRARLGVKVG
jgi:hypothetical protein